MLLTDLYENDLRQQIVALNRKLPNRWRDPDGREVWKNQRLEGWLNREPDDKLPEIIAHYEGILAYIKANPKQAKLSDPFAVRFTRNEKATLQTLSTRVGQSFDRWMQRLYVDPSELAQCRADWRCLLEGLKEYLSEELGIDVRDDGLVTFYHLTAEAHRLIGDLPVALYHFTSSGVLRSIREHGLEGERTPVNGRINPGVYLTTEQSGPAVDGYVRNAVRHHGGKGVTLVVKCYLDELEPDEDDVDITSGATQFMMPYVPPDRIKVER